MEIKNIEKTIKNLTDVFYKAGKISIELRNKGLIKHIKNDKTPVTNGDIEVNNIILTNLKKITIHSNKKKISLTKTAYQVLFKNNDKNLFGKKLEIKLAVACQFMEFNSKCFFIADFFSASY